MAILKDFISLIRLPNIIIVILTQSLVYFGMIQPALIRNGLQSDIGTSGLIQLCVITIIILTGGYLINDLLDVSPDIINKPHKQFIGKSIPVKLVKWIYISLGLAGFFLSWYYSLQHHVVQLLFLYPLSYGLLAFYSYSLKKKPLLGNILVSAFSAFVVGIILIFERDALSNLQIISPLTHTTLLSILSAFIVFGFLSSLFREIVKDIEDFKGDKASLYNTTAVAWGKKNAKIIAFITGTILLAGLISWSFHTLNSLNQMLRLYGLLLGAYDIIILYRLYYAMEKRDYSIISRSIKWMMVAGLLYLILYYILIYK